MKRNVTSCRFWQKKEKNYVFLKKIEKTDGRWIISHKTKSTLNIEVPFITKIKHTKLVEHYVKEFKEEMKAWR